jgi:alpha-methylacyl-CoA racemase
MNGTPTSPTAACRSTTCTQRQTAGTWLDRLGLAGADRDDPQRLRAALSAAFAGRTRDEWAETFAGSDACVAPVLSFNEAPHHPHLAARGTFETRGGVRQPAAAPRFSATPAAPGTPPPRPGEHDRSVLADWGVDC